jgi:hypothetical protein
MNALRLFLIFAVVGAGPAGAHRVDEYLQATRLAIDVTRVDLEMDLTAGSAVASEVLAWIDTDRDGEISQAEGDAYARQVLDSVVLKVDGRPAGVQLIETSLPNASDIRLGIGTIRVRAAASVQAVSAGSHQLSFLNMHRTGSSVYLVNALVPGNPNVRIDAQRRDRAQLGLTLDYSVEIDVAPGGTLALLGGVAVAAALVLRRGIARVKPSPPAVAKF